MAANEAKYFSNWLYRKTSKPDVRPDSTLVDAGDFYSPATYNGFILHCEVGGTTDSTPPSFTETHDAQVAEGGGSAVRWRMFRLDKFFEDEADIQVGYASAAPAADARYFSEITEVSPNVDLDLSTVSVSTVTQPASTIVQVNHPNFKIPFDGSGATNLRYVIYYVNSASGQTALLISYRELDADYSLQVDAVNEIQPTDGYRQNAS